MGKRSQMPDAVEDYVFDLMCREIPAAEALREETASLPQAAMQIGPDQAAFMAVLVRVSETRRALEVGTFTGYSALAVASALPEDGRLLCCDVSEEWTSIARRYWKQAGVEGKIQLRLGPAIETLEALLKQGAAGTFDFVFIDADKPNYDAYYELCLSLIRPGGLILVDNMLWHGKVVDSAVQDEETATIRALNKKICNDDRVDAGILTIGDGVMLARKREPREVGG